MKIKKVCWYGIGELLFLFNPVALITFFLFSINEGLMSIVKSLTLIIIVNITILSRVKVLIFKNDKIYQSWIIKSPFTKSRALEYDEIKVANFKVKRPNYGELDSILLHTELNNKKRKIQFYCGEDENELQLLFESKKIKIIRT